MPEEFIGDFIVQFGIKFGHRDTGRGFTEAKVDDYFYHPNGWHVSVSVDEKRVKELTLFITEFSAKYELALDLSDLSH